MRENDAMDAEMSDMEVEPQQHHTEHDVIRDMLRLARDLINQGNPSQALQAVIEAVKRRGGEAAVLESLDRAREVYRKKRKEKSAVDELASLFAECAIVEAGSAGTEQQSSIESRSLVPDARGTILAETGRTHIVLEAFSDGTSFLCLNCGGLVSKLRKDEHDAYWCAPI